MKSKPARPGKPGPNSRKKSRKVGELPQKPKKLSSLAEKHWETLEPFFPELGLTGVDSVHIANYCEASAMASEAARKIEDDGLYYTGPNGAMCKTPAVDVYFRAVATARGLGNDLGLSAWSRSRFEPETTPTDDSKSEEDEFFGRSR